MRLLRPANQRGHADFGWLDSRHSFSFGDYHDPQWTGFRSLLVINDDRLAPAKGFGMHPHRDMEIISFVVEGALQHRDSMGNGRIIRAGEFQYMSAGSGIRHSEFNPSPNEGGRFLQIWIEPHTKGLPPRYAELTPWSGPAVLIASADGRDDSLSLRQDAELWLLRLAPGATHSHPSRPGRHFWLQVVNGSAKAGETALAEGDGLAVSEEALGPLSTESGATVLLFDLA